MVDGRHRSFNCEFLKIQWLAPPGGRLINRLLPFLHSLPLDWQLSARMRGRPVANGMPREDGGRRGERSEAGRQHGMRAHICEQPA